MWYTILWLIFFLFSGASNLAIATPPFWALVVALLADIFINGLWGRKWARPA